MTEQIRELDIQRLAYYLGLAVMEATPCALLVALVGGQAWLALIIAVLVGALADWIVLRRVPPKRQSLAMVIGALLVAWWVVRGIVAPDAALSDDWGAPFAALVDYRNPAISQAYFGLLTSIFCFWRGTRLTAHDTISLHRLFRGSSIVLLLLAGFGFLGMGADHPMVPVAIVQLLTFFAVGLVMIAIASASEERETHLRRMGWRGTLTLLGAVALVLVLGLLIGSVFFEQVAAVGRGVVQVLVILATLVVMPVLILVTVALTWMVDHLDFTGFLQNRRIFDPTSSIDALQRQQQAMSSFPPWMTAAIMLFCGSVPILILIALIVFARARAKRNRGGNEERESLWSWGNLADDLRGLFQRKAKPQDEGLRGVLARLRGSDPVTRIRRSYVRMLLFGEAHERPRLAPQTPHEYATSAHSLVPNVDRPIDILTDAYERARYNPAAASPADAAAAEQAWSDIDRAEQRAKRES